jgi:molybdenum cofactor synthesis domain-containing protein
MKIGIITVSDRCSEGKREDESGPLIRQMVENLGEVIKYEIIPDEKAPISQAIKKAIDQLKVDLVLTTGGTGVSLRDVTPEATRQVLEREIPGFGEFMRQKSFKITPMAILSRATAGIRGKSLIINLPGSPKAVKECLEIILPVIPHALDMIKGKGHQNCTVLSSSRL